MVNYNPLGPWTNGLKLYVYIPISIFLSEKENFSNGEAMGWLCSLMLITNCSMSCNECEPHKHSQKVKQNKSTLRRLGGRADTIYYQPLLLGMRTLM